MWFLLGVIAVILFILWSALPATLLGNAMMIICAFFFVTIIMSAMHPGGK